MSFLSVEFAPYVTYLTPPLVGAFIGYLTNKVAIRMLFRPLKTWHVFGIRVPMTPGVIPSKRHQLADNMGEVVGDHLLTSVEIGKALQEQKFQQHLLNVIAERVGAILHSDLPALPELIPDKFKMYRDLGIRTIRQQLRDNVHKFIQTPEFEDKIKSAVDDKLADLLCREIGEVVGAGEREAAYAFIESAISRMLAGQAMAEWLDDFVRQQVYAALHQEKSLQQLLPESLLHCIENAIRQQTPNLLKKLAAILRDQEVRNGIVRGCCGGVENFIKSLGPMAPMVQNFISMELVDQKIREYLDEKEEDIVKWLSSDDLQEKVSAILSERFVKFSTTPLVEIIAVDNAKNVDNFIAQVSGQLALLLQGKEIGAALASMIRSNIEIHLEDGNVQLRNVLTDFLGVEGVNSLRTWIRVESVALLRSADTLKALDGMLDAMVDSMLNKRVGKLSNLLPSDVRKEIYVSIQKITSNMLEKEVPGLVDSLDIRAIVAKKLNSLDLLRLERLLLSIMEEQFKYINLFGALLGFLLGCGNLVFLYW